VSEQHDEDCPSNVVEHIAAIEAGWTLPKPWKAHDEDAKERENIEEVREMLVRWAFHGIALAPVEPREGER
jgi:hypothetical protein